MREALTREAQRSPASSPPRRRSPKAAGTCSAGPARRIDAIVGVAEALAAGSLTIDVGESREDLEQRLLALPGIGPWTAGYIALRVLGSPDILLTGDLALRQGAARLGLPSEARALAAYGARWAPWRSYAGMHLWRA